MAQADPRGAQGRKPKLGKTVMMDTCRGVLRVRKWPKPRGKPRNENEAYWQEWFREAQICAKYAPAQDIIAAREATKGTVWKPRDLQMKAMRGRMWTFITPDGRKIYSMAQRVDVSEGLDIISQVPGSMLVRGEMYWEYLVPGPEGYVLTSRGENMLPYWAPVSTSNGGGTLYKPPLLNDFPTWVNQGNAIAEQAPEGDMVLSARTVDDNNNILRVKQYPGQGFVYKLGIELLTGMMTNQSGGLYLRDSSTGELIRFALRYDRNPRCNSVIVNYYASETSSATNIAILEVGTSCRMFLQIKDEGGILTFSISKGNAAYVDIYSMQRNDYLKNIDQIGLGIMNGQSTQYYVSCSFFHYEEKTI